MCLYVVSVNDGRCGLRCCCCCALLVCIVVRRCGRVVVYVVDVCVVRLCSVDRCWLLVVDWGVAILVVSIGVVGIVVLCVWCCRCYCRCCCH